MKEMKKVELLAPAGNMEGFYGAIHAGADAVYLAGNRFGARAYAENFSKEEIIHCIRYAHILGRKVYLTVNTLIKENEFPELHEYLVPFYEAGLDAVIIQDMGAFTYIREHFPNLALHVSTQMTITGVHGARLLKELGAERIVPARELSLSEITYMKQETGLEIECFIHGAMCYCYSGQCLFSSMLGGRSGNRGRCAQPCRLPYMIDGTKGCSKECYPLSLKDMCTIEHLPELIESGIDSFKIEGRMKKAEYTAGVTAIYRKYIDKYYANSKNEKELLKVCKPSKEDMLALTSLYIRSERQNGYYFRHNGKDMVTLHNPAYSGSDDKLLADIRKNYIETMPKIPITMNARFFCGEQMKLTVEANGFSCIISGAIVDKAQKQPVTEENIKKQLGKLGDTSFVLQNLSLETDKDIFIPLKAINELRREAITALENSFIQSYGFRINRTVPYATYEESLASTHLVNKEIIKSNINITIQSMEQLLAIQTVCKEQGQIPIGRIYINGDLLLEKDNLQRILNIGDKLSEKHQIILSLPYILRKADASYLDKLYHFAEEYASVFKGFLVRSMEGFGYLLERKYKGTIFTDAGFYHWNVNSLKNFSQSISGFCLPLELNEREQHALLNQKILPCEKIVYGRTPMMITANCIAKTTGEECKGITPLYLIDRYKKKFPVSLNCHHCMNIIYNSVPLSLHGKLAKWCGKLDFRLDFTLEDYHEVIQILKYFLAQCQGMENAVSMPFKDYTTGHDKRGVE